MTRHSWSIWSFDDLVVGDEWESPRRTVTETDVVLFAGLSGDFNPLHVDHSSARSNPFGRPVAHGLLGLAIATGLMSQAPRVDTLAFLAILEWKFHRPIVFGDTIHALSTVRVVAASGQRTARRRHLAPKNPQSRWTPGSGRPHPNPRASTISPTRVLYRLAMTRRIKPCPRSITSHWSTSIASLFDK